MSKELELVEEGRGRPSFKLDERQIIQVESLAAYLSIKDIASYFGFSQDTFYDIKNRQPEVQKAYERGKARAITRVGSRLMEAIDAGNVTAMIFYLKTQGRWKETLTVEEIKKDTKIPNINIKFISTNRDEQEAKCNAMVINEEQQQDYGEQDMIRDRR